MALDGKRCVRVLIVDDEELGRRSLRCRLAEEDDVEVIGEAATAPDARQKILDLKPDLVFLDIEMPGGSGIELLQQLREPRPYVILVTAHPEFALPAFEAQAGDYLVKPVQSQRFSGSLLRAKLRIAEQRVAVLAAQLAGAVETMHDDAARAGPDAAPGAAPSFPDRLQFRQRRRLISLDVGEISWVQGASQYCRVHTRRGEFLLARTLASIECELDPERFFRIHRSAIVNVACVREVRSCGNGRYNIHLQGGLALPMGRARREILGKLLSGIAVRGA